MLGFGENIKKRLTFYFQNDWSAQPVPAFKKRCKSSRKCQKEKYHVILFSNEKL